MRKLTIFRKKKMVASIMKHHVFVQATNGQEVPITKENCINQGLIKNGKSLTIEVPEEAFYLIISYDKKIPKKFYTKLLVEAGSEPVELVEFPRYDPYRGNPITIQEKTG